MPVATFANLQAVEKLDKGELMGRLFRVIALFVFAAMSVSIARAKVRCDALFAPFYPSVESLQSAIMIGDEVATALMGRGVVTGIDSRGRLGVEFFSVADSPHWHRRSTLAITNSEVSVSHFDHRVKVRDFTYNSLQGSGVIVGVLSEGHVLVQYPNAFLRVRVKDLYIQQDSRGPVAREGMAIGTHVMTPTLGEGFVVGINFNEGLFAGPPFMVYHSALDTFAPYYLEQLRR